MDLPPEWEADREYRRSWDRACKLAGCPGRVLHDLRRTAVRNLIGSSVSERVAQKLTGHLTLRIFDAYDISSEADLGATVEKLAKRARK